MNQPDARMVTGKFFRVDVSEAIYRNVQDYLGVVVKAGAGDLKARLPNGFTRSNIEGMVYKGVGVWRGSGTATPTAKGTVHLDPSATRPVSPGTNMSRYGPKRRPFITLYVYETGHYGGRRGADRSRSEARSMGRSRTTWYPDARQGRTAHWVVMRTKAWLEVRVDGISFDLTKGL